MGCCYADDATVMRVSGFRRECDVQSFTSRNSTVRKDKTFDLFKTRAVRAFSTYKHTSLQYLNEAYSRTQLALEKDSYFVFLSEHFFSLYIQTIPGR